MLQNCYIYKYCTWKVLENFLECPLYGEEYDTSLHLLGRCSALIGKRRKQFGKHLLVPIIIIIIIVV